MVWLVRRSLGLLVYCALLSLGGETLSWAQTAAAPEQKEAPLPEQAAQGEVRLLPDKLPEDPLADLPGELPDERDRWAPEGDEAQLFGGPEWQDPIDERTPGLLGDGNSDSVLDTPLEPDVDAVEAERQRVLAGQGNDPAERFLGQGALEPGDGSFELEDGDLGSEYRDPVEW